MRVMLTSFYLHFLNSPSRPLASLRLDRGLHRHRIPYRNTKSFCLMALLWSKAFCSSPTAIIKHHYCSTWSYLWHVSSHQAAFMPVCYPITTKAQHIIASTGILAMFTSARQSTGTHKNACHNYFQIIEYIETQFSYSSPPKIRVCLIYLITHILRCTRKSAQACSL